MHVFMNFILLACVAGVAVADHWSVQEGAEVCIVMEANITGKLKYNEVTNETVEYSFNVTTTGSRGKCHEARKNESVQYLEIEFLPNDIKPPMKEAQNFWKLTVWFAPGHEQTFRVQDFELYAFFYSPMNASEQERTYIRSDHAEVEIGAEEKNGFKCSDSPLSFIDATVNLKNLRVIAFANLNSTDFPSEQQFEQCSLDARTSDIVPIIVGACLAGLVIAVLIAYLVGRARAKRQGYASV